MAPGTVVGHTVILKIRHIYKRKLEDRTLQVPVIRAPDSLGHESEVLCTDATYVKKGPADSPNHMQSHYY